MSAPMLSVLIVDDEAPARERLRRLISELEGWQVAGACASGIEALDLAGALKPAVVLLDIRMPGMGGIEAARHLSALETPPAVIFTTAYDQYALDAFDSKAVGYLLKPIRRERLAEALQHAARLSPPQLQELSESARPPVRRRHIAVRVRSELRLIPVKEIVFFRAEQKYVVVRHGSEEYLIDESLKQLAKELFPAFVRAHRSLLVSMAHIEVLERDDDGRHFLRMHGLAERLPVSRRQLADLRRQFAAAR
jgi:two-component system response regulator AlgR